MTWYANGINLNIWGSYLVKAIIFLNSNSFATVNVSNATWGDLGCLFDESNVPATKYLIRGILYNNGDFTKRIYQLTINAGSTTSNVQTVRYQLSKMPTLANILVTPQGNLNGITSYYPVWDATNKYVSVTSNAAPTANVTFNVLVDVSR